MPPSTTREGSWLKKRRGSGSRQMRLAAKTQPNWPISGSLQASPTRNSTLLRSWVHTTLLQATHGVCVRDRERGEGGGGGREGRGREGRREREREGGAHNLRVDTSYLLLPEVTLSLQSVHRAAGHLQLLASMDEGSREIHTYHLIMVSCQLK